MVTLGELKRSTTQVEESDRTSRRSAVHKSGLYVEKKPQEVHFTKHEGNTADMQKKVLWGDETKT